MSNSNAWLIKTNDLGDTLWTKTYGGSDDDGANSVQQTTDGGYILTGWTESFGMGDYDVWLVRTNNSGDLLWTKTIGGISSDGGQEVQQTTDGGFILTGHTNSFGAGDSDVWLIKTNPSGDTLWTKTFGGIASDVGSSIQQTLDGGYIITGTKESIFGNKDVYLIKTNDSGEFLWAKTFGGAQFDEGLSVIQTIDGGYIISANTFSFGSAYSAIWLIKTDSIGDSIWTKIIWENNGLNSSYSVQQTQDDGYIIVGFTEISIYNWDILLVRTDSSGNILWTKTFESNGMDTGFSIELNTDGCYAIAGAKESSGAGGNDVWIIKTTSDVSNVKLNYNQFVSDFSLQQNYPNPFNSATAIQYSILQRSNVRLKVFDILGKEVTTLVNEEKDQGVYTVNFDANNLASGLYLYSIQAGSFVDTKKMILLK
jgi:hypothetical protein